MRISDWSSDVCSSDLPEPFAPENLYTRDPALCEAVAREGAAWAEPALIAYGAAMASEGLDLGVDANRFRPLLRTHDRYGHRVDEIEYHPSYHRLMTLGVEHGVHADRKSTRLNSSP